MDSKVVERVTSRSIDTDLDQASEKYGLQDDCPLFEGYILNKVRLPKM
jgi:hypothetical protein